MTSFRYTLHIEKFNPSPTSYLELDNAHEAFGHALGFMYGRADWEVLDVEMEEKGQWILLASFYGRNKKQTIEGDWS